MADTIKSAKIKIGGMHCVMCVKNVEKTLSKKQGIKNVSVNLANEEASLLYDESLIDLSSVKNIINDLGYEYKGIAGEKKNDGESFEETNREDKNFVVKLRIFLGFSIGVLLMLPMFFHFHYPWIQYIMFIIATPVFIFLSSPIFKASINALKNRFLTMDVMYSMGIGIAYLSSVLGTFGILPGEEFMFYDSAVMLCAFLILGRYLESKARSRTGAAIRKLIGLKPKTALRLRGDKEDEINIDEILIGDFIIVKPGERFPVDGEVTNGSGFVDESAITGEPMPVFKKSGDSVISGTISTNSIITFRAKKVGADTMLSQIIKLVETAQTSKPPIQHTADKIVSWFIPAILSIALITFLAWSFVFDASLAFSIGRLISILVIACPCALGLASPTAMSVGLGRGAELGILIKNTEAVEKLGKVSHLVFDKTGTITFGKPNLTDIIPIDIPEQDLLRIVASCEKNSEHPIASAVVDQAIARKISLSLVEEFSVVEGRGVRCVLDGRSVFIGSKTLMDENPIFLSHKIKGEIEHLQSQAKTIFLAAIDNTIRGVFAVEDAVKPGVSEAISSLKSMKIQTLMITGDSPKSAEAALKKIGANNFLAGALPKDKIEKVRHLQSEGAGVCFVGDGINDAPALSQADVGIALGGGTDIAKESGDIVLVKNDFSDAVAAIELARKILGRIRQNLFWAFAYNVLLIPFAAGVFYPSLGITVKPEFAGLAMALSSITVVSFSLMLKNFTPKSNKNHFNK